MPKHLKPVDGSSRIVRGHRVDRDIPLPPADFGAGRKWPFLDMEVGESVAIPIPSGKHPRNFQSEMGNTARNAGSKRYGMKFATRIEGDTVRVWRTA